MRGKDSNRKEINAYILSITGLTLALFIPFSALILNVFRGNTIIAAIILSVGMPLAALIIGIFALLRSRKPNTRILKVSKIISILSIIIGGALTAFNIYTFINIFIKYGRLSMG